MVHKFKKYSKKIMCILSACMFFVMAVFYPLESFRADVVSVPDNTFRYNFTFSFIYEHLDAWAYGPDYARVQHNMSIFPDGYSLGSYDFQFFYFCPDRQIAFTTSDDIFAYRVVPAFTSVGPEEYSYVYSDYLSLGTSDELEKAEGLYLGDISAGYHDAVWYVNDYSDGIPIYVTPVFMCENSQSSTVFTECYVRLYAAGYLEITPYRLSDLSDELYVVLSNIYSNDQQMLTKLNQIYSSLDTVETKLQNLYSIANSQLTYLKEIDTNTDELESLMGVCNTALADIKAELEEQTTWLEKIYNALIEYLGIEGDEPVEDVPVQDMDNMLDVEGELLGDASADDLENDLNVSIDIDSSSFVWDLIDRLITSNTVVFGGFISVLSLGIVALILGR